MVFKQSIPQRLSVLVPPTQLQNNDQGSTNLRSDMGAKHQAILHLLIQAARARAYPPPSPGPYPTIVLLYCRWSFPTSPLPCSFAQTQLRPDPSLYREFCLSSGGDWVVYCCVLVAVMLLPPFHSPCGGSCGGCDDCFSSFHFDYWVDLT